MKLTVAIITYNEEKNIERCLQSILKIADEILVVDSFSTDQTEEICKRHNVRFIKNPFAGHIEQKNFALDLAQGDYVLSLDADEALDANLLAEISKLKEAGFKASGYRFKRLTHYVDQWIWHCGWYPDKKLRLVKKGSARWQGVNPHDIWKLQDGSAEVELQGNLLHYSYHSIADHINQTNKFTTIAALASYQKGVRSSVFKIVTRPVLKFLRDYFYKLGFLDGRYGFIICCINALSALLKYGKIYDLQRKTES